MSTDPNIVSEIPGEREVEAWLQSLPKDWPALGPLKQATEANIVERTILLVDKMLVFLLFQPGAAGMLSVQPPPTVLRDVWFEGGQEEKRRKLRDDAATIYQNAPLSRFLLLCPESDVKATKMIADPDRARDLEEGWHQQYQGTTLEHFLQAMTWYESNYDPVKHYGRIVAIIQSSGSGKSRLVDELALKYPVFNVVFRQTDDLTSGWPPRDRLALQFFQDHSEQRAMTEIRGEEMAAAFIGALMDAISDHWDFSLLKGERSKSRYGLPGSPEAAQREAFFQIVYDRANIMLRENESFLVEERKWIEGLGEKPKDSTATDERKEYDGKVKTSSPAWHQKLFRKFCEPAFEHLRDKLHAAGETKFFLALDECTMLGRGSAFERAPLRRSSLIALQRILKAAEHITHPVSFWFLLLDTNSSVVMLHPAGPHAASFRLTGDLQPLPPFVYLDFNQLMELMLRIRASDSLLLEGLKYCGRPLWSTIPSSSVINAAQRKLFGPEFDPDSLQHVLAAFASRACLKLAGNEAANLVAAEAVGHHMRILVSVVKTTLKTEVPSEPILAIASADALTKDIQKYSLAFRTLLEELIRQNSVLAAGEIGELCSRLLILLARDMATRRLHGSFVKAGATMTDGTDRIHAIELHELFKELLGDKDFGFAEKGLAADLLEFCKNKWVNMTHFIEYEKPIDELTLDELKHAWFIGAGIQCTHSQAVIDGGIIYHVGPLNANFKPRNLRFLPYQTKAKTASAGSRIGDGLTAPPILHPKLDGSGGFRRVKEPTIVLLMDLGSTSIIQESKQKTRLERRVAERNKKWVGYADEALGEDEPENFFLNIRGCTASTYPVLRRFVTTFEKLFNQVLADQLPGELQTMENSMVEAMFPIERLTKAQKDEKEAEEKAEKARKAREARQKKKNLAEREDESSFPDLQEVREALPSLK